MNDAYVTSISVAPSVALADAQRSQVISPAIDFAARDPLGRIEEASFWLETYQHSIGASAVRAFEVVDHVDNRAQSDRLLLMREYLRSSGRMQSHREQRIWQALVGYARELSMGYETCLRLMQSDAGHARELKPAIPMIVARALRALSLEVRCALLRYANVDPGIWVRMGTLYAFAEKHRFAALRLKVYAGMQGDSTVRREYLRGLLLAVSGMDNLLPPSQVVAERIVAAVAEFFLLHRSPTPSCRFGVALQAGRAPYRLSEDSVRSPGVRFFGPGDAGVMVEGYLRRIVEARLVPAELKLHEGVAPALVGEVLLHLSRQWAATPPARREKRQAVITTMQVAHGFQRVLDTVLSEPGDERLAEVTEVWTVVNESSGGFGAVLPPLGEGDWLMVGTLVAAKPMWPASWSIGVIRRLSSADATQRSIGVEILARAAIAVQLVPQSGEASSASLTGLLLATEAPMSNASSEVSFVLPKGASKGLESAEVRIHDRRYILTHGRICYGSDDFELARFSVHLG